MDQIAPVYNVNSDSLAIESMILPIDTDAPICEPTLNSCLDSLEDINNILGENLSATLATYLPTPVSNQNSFDTFCLDFTDMSQLPMSKSFLLQSLPPVSEILQETGTIDNVILNNGLSTKTIQLKQNPTVSQNQSTSVTPFVQLADGYGSSSLVTTEMQIEPSVPSKINLLAQPRTQYRPRTQNESKLSSHYIRCKEGDKFDYPTAEVRHDWARESSVNIIEVALVDIEGHPHPYSLDHKAAQSSFADGALIIKQNDPNIIYFRLTNDDFVRNYKTFQIELIKSKQDETITKKLIRRRKLEQSILRFTRIFQNKQGILQRDPSSVQYSCTMIESYGDVSVEFINPKFSPMCGNESMFISLKGRFVKDDIQVFIRTEIPNWQVHIDKLSVSGNIVYFTIPSFVLPQVGRINACVQVHFKQQIIHQSTFLYTNLLDQELTKTQPKTDYSLVSDNSNLLQINWLDAQNSMLSSIQSTAQTKSKTRKRQKTKS